MIRLPDLSLPSQQISELSLSVGLGGPKDHMVHLYITIDGKPYDFPVDPDAATKLAALMIQAAQQVMRPQLIH